MSGRNGPGRDRQDAPRQAPVPPGQLPPQNLEVERAFLGSVLIDPSTLDEVIPIVQPDDLWRDRHQEIWRAIVALYEAGHPIDGLTVGDELRSRGQWRGHDDETELSEIIASVPHAANCRYYADLIRGISDRRAVIAAANRVIRSGYANEGTSAELIETAEREIFAIHDRRAQSDVGTIGDAATIALARIEERRSGASGLASPWTELDRKLDGFQPGMFYIIAARPSMGKTALAGNILDWVTLSQRVPALFVSLEMGKAEIAERFLCTRSGVSNMAMRDPNSLTPDLVARIGAAYGELKSAPLWIDDTPVRSMLDITAVARRYKSRHGLGLIVVDYIQLVAPADPKDMRQEQIAQISARLKTLAREMKIPVVALAQLNRKVEERDSKVPRMSDLRESGAMEQDADVVMLLHRPSYYKPDDEPGIAHLIVGKNRNGPTGTVSLAWRHDIGRFDSLPGTDGADTAARLAAADF